MESVGVTFNDTIHTYKKYGLKLKKIEIGLPKTKSKYQEVPGMNGRLDLTIAQHGGVVYDMRTITLTFDARNCNYERWSSLVSVIAQDLHGKECRIVLDTDVGYYYEGRPEISTKKSNEEIAELVIECYCNPYKIDIHSSEEPWEWDTFNFINGVIRSTSDIVVNNTSSWKAVTLIGWPHNETLRIVSTASMTVRYRNYTYSISAGDNIMYDIELFEGDNILYFQGRGTITIVQRGGMI